jgi:carboxyl-terminal processing protease
MTPRTRILALFCVALACPSAAAPTDQADPDEVGKWMAIALQNGHFSRLPFSKLSPRFLDSYLKLLDPGKVYFTREDIGRFERDYGDTLDDLLMKGDCMRAAEEISRTFVARVDARIAEAERLLAEPDFDFSLQEIIPASRKDAAWPKDEAEAMTIWRQEVKESLLAEILRREQPAAQSETDSPEAKLAARYRRLRADVVADSSPDKMAAGFLRAIARSFDPHTQYMSERDVELFNEEMRNELNGIGVSIQADPGGPTVIRGIFPKGPADLHGGLHAGDRVVEIDPDSEGPREPVEILFMSSARVSELIRGKAGTPVSLKVAGADGGGMAEVSLLRGQVPVEESLASAQLIRVKDAGGERRLGYILLPGFYRDFEKEQTSCSRDVEELILRIDLRGNGGGSLAEAQRMTGLFTGKAPVTQVKDGFGKTIILDSTFPEPLFDGPLVVLTDRGSASSSEIFAAALQDDNRAVIVGEAATFGKGTVQTIKDLGESLPFFSPRKGAGALRLTVQKFYRPSGLSTQNRGVIPDIVLPGLADGHEMGEGDLDHALGQDRIAPANGFRPLERAGLFLPEITGKSAARVAADQDFAYLREDAARMKQRLAANQVSLNLDERRKEMAQESATARQREEERRGRFGRMAEEDGAKLAIHRLTLADLKSGAGLQVGAIAAREKRPGPAWPSGLDPWKREAMAVLGDLVEATQRKI